MADAPETEPELTPEETGERENSLSYWLGPRTDTAPHTQKTTSDALRAPHTYGPAH
ncbi:hypothetical protein [Streptomyces sp. NPDC002215]|uniref:hypothetical protein n=1 Tax=Streptomyces sp. NPDC002215 TaxID=3154412 RepID=UPI00332806A7